MIIGCLGKGGSGKSTIATLLTKYLVSQGKCVLAIDADHNMDLSHNLGAPLEKMSFIGSSLPSLLSYVGLSKDEKYYEIFSKEGKDPVFHFSGAQDLYTKHYAHPLSASLFIMTAGPHTENILHGKYCSHSLATPLKVYLPFLSLQNDNYVVVDEKAGSDGAGTGVCTGFDVGCIMVEPTEHGVKAAKQIAELLDFFGTPYVFVGNKVMDEEDMCYITKNIPCAPVTCISHGKMARGAILDQSVSIHLSHIIGAFRDLDITSRKRRSKEKFEKNKNHTDVLV
ncbi:MAG: hypothetical protein CL685_01340 [Candidatus Magasanikbacteria bacterium]|nr:hypothetical protein [Candidatus Magasanikbacteria bacterium]|tara:strand:+ start:822 stop:1667 length:846 start_codon:yes stop_codon:yes gene_type:complete